MSRRYPDIEPFAHGMLDVGDGHLVHWESCGNPQGKPALVVHGGPGSGAGAFWRRFFDPERYRVVLFDQRGCGRSTPDAGDLRTDLSTNTTPHLLADMEQLRTHLGIERWLLLGASWGSALALGYAQRHPERVTEIVLFSVVTSTPAEHRWLTRDLGRIFPEQWERFRDAVPAAERDGNLPAAYARLLANPDEAVRDQAARAWCAWEDALVSNVPGAGSDPRWADPAFRLTFTRLVTHYWAHDGWFADGELMAGASRLAGIPGALIHGRLDLGGPVDIPWQLARAWPDATLQLIDDAGHGAGRGIGDAVVAALDRFATR
ncbi:MAG TPA: prolyl aminopeptidase [Actinoplanes sp.]